MGCCEPVGGREVQGGELQSGDDEEVDVGEAGELHV